ncbi:MAG: hypothetical protein HRF52_04030 [Ignavibacterium sp.]|jgi:hypothetical protein|uniref:hypothetical protein n=1 Tax=Ignavibacterium sp. TaxID=2651167 RepID=UPI003297EDFF
MNGVRERVRVRVRVSEHAIKQYKNRIIMNENLGKKQIIDQIKLLFTDARYVSDNENGILFRNEDLMVEFIVKNGCLITLFPIGKKGDK